MKQILSAILALALSAAILPSAAFAYGAVATGLPSNVAKNGFAVGASTDFPSTKTAASEAMKQCKSGNSKISARSLCKVVKTFKGQCFAVAYDARSGKSGFGWSVTSSRWKARSEALATCRANGGKGNQCQVAGSDCD